ncbi:MAG TPA: hypothetical protein PKH24_01380 [Sedimentisphaerales bacterium]|jgi:hypothetical protein|nr:hypothetical protein [Sedimentisphaerales bacterium]HNU28145.1 hypothetical protein [Sedimentisphaerales bacterium]
MASSNSSYSDWLAAYRETTQRDLNRFRSLQARWSTIRLVAFIAGVAIVVLLRQTAPMAVGAAMAGLAVFMAAVRRHTIWEGKRAFAERALTIAGESHHASTRRDCPARSWERPQDALSLPQIVDPGPTWPLTDQEHDDLDLYAPPVGIFGLLNHTSTPQGARRLRDILDSPSLSPEHIRRRQEAVRWLEHHPEQRLELMATIASLRSRSRHLDRLVLLLHETQRPRQSAASGVIRLWSIASGLLFLGSVLAIASGKFAWVRPLEMLVLINVAILTFARSMFRRLGDVVAPWTTLPSTLRCVLTVSQHGAKDLPDQTQLGLLKERFRDVASHARIPSLCGWLEWAGLHGLVRGILNLLVFFDLHIAEAVLARVVPHRNVLLYGLSAMAELEALCSLASLCAELPVACYPQPGGDRTLDITDGYHPLIPQHSAVPNSIRLAAETSTWVVTGPNAAGKSTCLRMVGVNVLLAQIGAAAAAKRMTWSPLRLITDVRIRDDLAHNESYFLSEVRRLRRIVLDAQPGPPMLGLIDEPFRGTNSQERAAAGIALLEHLMASKNLFLIATHEELLARTAANCALARNFHFQEHLLDGGIAFDYLLRPGPAQTKTALRILEQEGYPPALLDRARHLMTDSTQTGERG